MTRTPRLVSLALGIALGLLALASCSDSTTPKLTDAGKKDSVVPRDRGLADQSPTDAPRADGPLHDAARPDLARDQVVADQVVADQVVVWPDGGSKCTTDKDCKAFDDCCDCKGIFAWDNPGICKKMCLISTCTSLGISAPTAYCAAGRCLITQGTAATPSCAQASDCKKVDNCCDCLALPAKVTAPPCGISTCFVSGCVSQGLANAVVKCDTGICKLVP